MKSQQRLLATLLVAVVLPTLVACATRDEVLEQLCYQVSWDLASPRPKRQAIRPVSAFPSGHAYVNSSYCGQQKSPGDVIPSYGLWPSHTDRNACQNVTGGSVFYAYQYPAGASSNTGFEQTESDLLYFVVDEDLRVSFVLVHDKAHDGTGGKIGLEIDSPDLANQGVRVLQEDDIVGMSSESCAEATNDCYYWDPSTGSGDFFWAWIECCTDGLVLGHISDLEWRFNIRYTYNEDIDKFKIGNFREDTNDMDFITLDEAAVRNSGVEVRALTCESYCQAKASCGECIADPQCGWCESTGCTTTSLADTCDPAEWQSSGCCAVCEAHTDCTSCINTPGCGWSYDLGQCLSGAYTQGSCLDTTWYQLFEANVTECLYPGGPVFSNSSADNIEQGVVVDWCSGNGNYSFEERTCVCEYGYFGADCARECPGGADNVCSGHGECDMLTGQCYCDCGFAGANCSITGCACTDDLCFLSEEGACPNPCGRNLADRCTGSDVLELPEADRSSARLADPAGRCACTSKFWGPSCNLTCPGISSDGTGNICGGHGTCNVVDGTCECDPCYAVDPGTGLCVDAPCPTCLFDGECVCEGGIKTCSCKGQRSGHTCELCDCLNNGTCNSITGECDCAYGFLGEICDFACTRETLCHGHGNCNGVLRRCDCDADYIGDEDHQCEFYCPEGTCLNNGTCSPVNGSCLCQVGYFGDSCQNNTCQLDPCQNGGSCRMDFFNKEFGYSCDCAPGFEGQDCEIDIDECLLGNDCYGAECIDQVNGYTCKCLPGYIRVTDTACVEIDECLVGAHFCHDHATCVNQPGGYDCVCNEGYDGSGEECSDVDECALGTHSCDRNAVCANTEGSYTCTCVDGYLGDGFTTGVGCQDYCWDSPCLYGGVCNFTRSNYTCTCAEGYEGVNCELNATVCDLLSPCTQDATCINGRVVAPGEFPDFTCNCSAGLGHPSCAVLKPSASTQTVLEGETAPYIFAAIGAGALLLLVLIVVVSRRRRSSGSPQQHRGASTKETKFPQEGAAAADDNGSGIDAADAPSRQSTTSSESNDSAWLPEPDTTSVVDDGTYATAQLPPGEGEGGKNDAKEQTQETAQGEVDAPTTTTTATTGAGESDVTDQQQEAVAGRADDADGQGEVLAVAAGDSDSPYADLLTVKERRTSALVRGEHQHQQQQSMGAIAEEPSAAGSKANTLDKVAALAEEANAPEARALQPTASKEGEGNKGEAAAYYSVGSSAPPTTTAMYEVLTRTTSGSAIEAETISAFDKGNGGAQ